MGTLFVVGAPGSISGNLTRRALQTLRSAALIVAEDEDHAQWLLTSHSIRTPVVSAGSPPNQTVLPEGDVALLLAGDATSPSPGALKFIRRALDSGCSVVPIPGPSEPISALILSGLASENFVYLGELPDQPIARRAMLDEVQSERRTLVLISRRPEVAAVTDLRSTLGDRKVCLFGGGERQTEVIWEGKMSEFPGDLLPTQIAGLQVWVFGAQQEQPEPWSEVRLTAAIGQYLSQGLPIKEISQKLAVNSGWPRRQIYHKCVQLVKRDRDEEGERKARPGGA